MDRCDLKTLDLVKMTPGVAITEVTGYGHYVIPMNVTVAPFNCMLYCWLGDSPSVALADRKLYSM